MWSEVFIKHMFKMQKKTIYLMRIFSLLFWDSSNEANLRIAEQYYEQKGIKATPNFHVWH